MKTSKKTKEIKYFDSTTQSYITKTVEIPAPVNVKSLDESGRAEVIKKPRKLKAVWSCDILQDVMTPLSRSTRLELAGELKKVLTEPDEIQAVDSLATSWHFDDDKALKLIGRLIGEVSKHRHKRERSVGKLENLLHEKHLMTEERKNLKREVKTLTGDIVKLVNERDEALRLAKNARGSYASSTREATDAKMAREALADESKKHRLTCEKLHGVESALTQSINDCAAITAERDILQRDAQRNIEIALTEYETAVVGKLGSVAEDHKVAVEKNKSLMTQVEGLKTALAEQAKVNTESAMIENEATIIEVPETLTSGDEVYCKISYEGPFVLMTQVEEAEIEYMNPIANKKNGFSMGKIQVSNAWLVRCKDGTFRTLPAPVLTKVKPKSTLSFNGIKGLITSDVTSKLFQAAIWVTMLGLLAANQVG